VGAYDRGVADSNLAPEAQARVLIDERLRAAGWHVCDRSQIDLVNHVSVAVREVPMADGHGVVDYLLFADRKPVGVLEAKKDGVGLAGVEWQSAHLTTITKPTIVPE
jgi:type I restriction enzyme R subunit